MFFSALNENRAFGKIEIPALITTAVKDNAGVLCKCKLTLQIIAASYIMANRMSSICRYELLCYIYMLEILVLPFLSAIFLSATE